MKLTLLLFTLLLIFLSTIAQTEKMAFKNLTPSMGLSHGDVISIYQDHEGYMWIGTADGLNKYDGIAFTVYKYNKKDSTSLSSNSVNCIYEDKLSNLWIGLSNGLCRYNRDKNYFERISFSDDHNKKFEYPVNSLYEDRVNKLWICTNNGIFWLDKENKMFRTCFTDIYGKNILINFNEIQQDKNGILWFASPDPIHGGILKYDPVTQKTDFYNTLHPTIKLHENQVYSLIVDNQNNIWAGSYSKGLSMINERAKTITNYQKELYNNHSLSNNFIYSLAQNLDGKILIGSNGGGLNTFDPVTKVFNHYTANESDGSLLGNNISKIFIGPDGILWIGCWGGGVSMYDKRYNKFTHYKQEKENTYSLSGTSVTCFAEDLKRNIWIAADGGGITFFGPKEKKFIRHLSSTNNYQTLTNNKVLALETDAKGGLWAGMWQGGLNYFQVDGNKLILEKKYSFVDETDPNSTSVFTIYRNKAGELWVGNFKTGAYLFDPKTERFKSMISFSDPTGKINIGTTVNNILSDYKDDVWFATSDSGLIRLNRKTGIREHFTHREDDSTSISSNSIAVLYEDSKKRLWVGSAGGGLSFFNRQTNTFTHYTTNQGLPDNWVVGILEDSHQNLWISSHSGISKATIVSTKEKLNITFRNYTVQDGLQSKIFNYWSFLKGKSGEMYFGGINGFNVFHPDSVKDNSYLPPVHITDFLLFNKPVIIGAKGSPLDKHISQTKKLVLHYNQSFLTFRFIALNYIFSEKNQYAYIMQGFEKDWNYVGNKKDATYTNLDPGEYNFRVKASNNDGIWNEEGTSLKIIILPPWWGTWWFKLIVITIIILFITYILLRVFRRMVHTANQTILNERNQLKTLINNIPDYIFIKDTKARFLIINDLAIEFMGGKDENDFINKTDFHFYPKEISEKYYEQEMEIITTGRPLINEESKVTKKDQTLIMSTTKCPIINTKGETIGLVGIVKDITKQKLIEQEIIKQSDELQNYNERLNETNTILEERQQQIEEQAEELHVQAEVLKEVNNLLVSKQQLIQKQSETLKETNEQLSVLNATKDRFFSIIAHDLRNPFHTLIGFSELLLNKFEQLPVEKVRKYLQMIYASSHSGHVLLENLLQWSRTQTGHVAYDPIRIKLMEITEETFILLSGEAQQKNIALESRIHPDIFILADENMMKTILRNLITNAIKFTPEHGNISIRASIQQSMAEITIADTGVGISDEDLKKLFRIDTNYTTIGTAQEKGTGLGLLLCREFVEKHGGKIWVESTEGKGSEFKFTLPAG